MTNRITSPAVGLLLGLALLLGLGSPPAAAAKKIPVNLRVVTHQGKIIFDKKVRTGTTRVKPNAACLGGRRGPARKVRGATAIGLLYQASLRFKALRPLKLSDGDFGFGVCGIAGISAQNEEWWVLRHNWKDAAGGAEVTRVKRGDRILLYLSKTYMETTPDSLALVAPRTKVRKGARLRVRVVSVSGTGKRSPVRGVKVRGADGARTNARGYTRLTITGKTKLVARSGDLIPSNRVYMKIRKNRKK